MLVHSVLVSGVSGGLVLRLSAGKPAPHTLCQRRPLAVQASLTQVLPSRD